MQASRDPQVRPDMLARASLPDRQRAHLLWLAGGLVLLLTAALVALVTYSDPEAAFGFSEATLLIGLLTLVTCAVAYLLDKEREQRSANRTLIRELHETTQALDARIARLNQLSETSAHLVGALDTERISQLVVEVLVSQVHADAASLVLMDKSRGEYYHACTTGPLTEQVGRPYDAAAIAKAMAGDAPAMHALEREPALTQQLEAWDRVRAAISAPVTVSGMVGGALAAMRQESFDSEELGLLTTLANMASKAIESAELHQRLRESYFRTLHVLARSLAARDPYSATHGEAVTWLAGRLAEAMEAPEAVREALRAFGPLHDLGKIGLADSVLLKPAPLTADEAELCRQHVQIGAEIIEPLNPGAVGLSVVRSHHERWDGGGYPEGLAAEEIPLPARLLAVADAFHAIISHRPYRGGSTVQEAVQEITLGSGTQFDPAVVTILARLWESGELSRMSRSVGAPRESLEEPVSALSRASRIGLPGMAVR
jgi:response regulator RpfG family c-di-GMP phosphodiesterase